MANHLYGYNFSYGGGDGTPKSSSAAAISRSLADPYLLSDSALRYDPDHSKYSSSSVRYSTASPYFSSEQPWPPGVDSSGRLTTAFKRSSEVEWWTSYGGSFYSKIQKFALKVLSLTCSVTCCERNWSVFQQLHNKRRNRLAQQRLNNLVFVKYNRSLRRRYDMRDSLNPILLDDIDDCNDWLTGRLDGYFDMDDYLVFDNEPLTWDQVATSVGVYEPTYHIRSKTGGNPSSSRNLSTFKATHLRLIDENNELEDTDEEEIDHGNLSNGEDDELPLDDDDDFSFE